LKSLGLVFRFGSIEAVVLLGSFFSVSLGTAIGGWEGRVESAHFLAFFSERDRKVAEEVVRIAEKACRRITADIGIELDERIYIYVCGTKAEFRRLLRNSVQEWAAAVAIPSIKAIVAMAPRALGDSYPGEMGKIIAHEVTHVVIGVLLGDRVGIIPRWVHEGIAVYEAGEWGLGWSWTLGSAAIAGRLIPLSNISHGFPDESSDALLAYAQSYSAISYIMRKFGSGAIRDMLVGVKEGLGFEDAFTKAIGLSPGDFEEIWRSYVRKHYTFITAFTSSAMFWFAVSLLFLLAYFAKKRKERERMRRWEMEELLYRGRYEIENGRDEGEDEGRGGEKI